MLTIVIFVVVSVHPGQRVREDCQSLLVLLRAVTFFVLVLDARMCKCSRKKKTEVISIEQKASCSYTVLQEELMVRDMERLLDTR